MTLKRKEAPKTVPSSPHVHKFAVAQLKDAAFTIGVGMDSGRLESLDMPHADFGRWNTIPGRLEIVDELTPGHYRDGQSACDVVARQEKDGSVVVEKRFRGACFGVREKWAVENGEARWDVSVSLDKGEAPRSIRIRQFVPWATSEPYRWDVWTAQQHFPRSVVQVGQTSMVYGDLCFGTAIPILTIFSGRADVGLSLAKPFGLRIPRWAMVFDGYRGGGVTIESGHMKLASGHPAETALMLHPHEGCWRPGLGWLVRKYPTYFQAGHPDASKKVDGGFLIGSPSTTTRQARLARSYGAKVAEMHHHYRYYGDYFPERGTWRTIEGDPPREAIRKDERSVEVIRKSIKMFRRNKIAPLLYIQIAGDGYQPYVEKKFPESIALNTDGQRMGQKYYKVWMMNSDPSLPFGKSIGEELARFFRLYPEAGGLFWDQACYDDLDSAHHDGITMVDNQPMYRLAYCYEPHRDWMVDEAHRRGMVVSANGLLSIELGEGIDQIMAEGTSWLADVIQYECVARPMLFYHYFKDADDVEEMFQKCLIAGATGYAVPNHDLPADAERLFRVYTSLVAHLKGRTWLLEPRPLTLPRRVDGNIFTGGDGNLYVTLVSSGQSLRDAGKPQPVTFHVRSRKVSAIRSVTYWNTHGKELRAGFQIEGDVASITLPKHKVASVVRIELAVRNGGA